MVYIASRNSWFTIICELSRKIFISDCVASVAYTVCDVYVSIIMFYSAQQKVNESVKAVYKIHTNYGRVFRYTYIHSTIL